MNPEKYDEHRVESAIHFLFKHLRKSKNPKPVGLHSIRVAERLWKANEAEDIVVAALLHDVVEDTEATIDDVESEFGEAVAHIVNACTFDNLDGSFTDKLEKAKQSIDKACGVGYGAQVVKAADLVDNANYYERVTDRELKKYLKSKYEYFMKRSEPSLYNSTIWKDVSNAYESKVVLLSE